jgi:hypothetical protein
MALETRAKTQDEQMQKLTKKTPTAGRKKAALLSAQSRYEEDCKKWEDLRDAGESKAEERASQRATWLLQLNQTVESLSEAVYEAEEDLCIKHAGKKIALSKAKSQVLDIFSTKLKELESAQETTADVVFLDAQETAETTETETEKALSKAVEDAKTHQECAAASTANMQAQIENLQRMLEEQLKKEAMATAEAETQEALNKAIAESARKREESAIAFELVEPRADPETLPVINCTELGKAHPEAVAACGNLYQLLNRWRQMGAAVPFTFEEIITYSTAAKDAPTLIKRLLGKQWGHWFPDNPQPHTTLPRQAVLSLLFTLERAKEQYDEQEAAKQEAKESYEKLAETSKKRRVA